MVQPSSPGEKFALGTAEEQAAWQHVYDDLVSQVIDRPELSEHTGESVGKRVPRKDVLYKVRGKAKYAANLTLPNMLHGRFLRSIHPYARIRGIDTSKAECAPGVHAVLTAADVTPDRLYVGSLVQDTPFLAADVVRYVGEPIVAIARARCRRL
jgi:CO/xanthine dehydrogenase Mo-binding subunit